MHPFTDTANRMTLLGTLIFILGCGGCKADSLPEPSSASAQPEAGRPIPMAIDQASRDSGAMVLSRAKAFIATLSAEQRTRLLQDYTFANASRWHTYPQWALGKNKARIGLALGTLSAEQWQAFNGLLAAATGSGKDEGYDEIQQHLSVDDWIRQNGGREGYGRGNFHVAFLGPPSDTGTWQLQFGGHHLALNNTYRDGVLVGATPSFRAIEPHTAIEHDGTILKPQLQEWETFVALLASLDPAQRAAAKLSRKQDELLLGPEARKKDWNFPNKPEGIPVSSLTDEQRSLLMKAIGLYVNDISDASAASILSRYRSGLGSTYLGFSGSTSLTNEGDYVRIDGPTVWIELVMDPPYSTDSPHVHAVWRDKLTDYGGTKP